MAGLVRLTRALVSSRDFQRRTDIVVPGPEVFDLPEKAVQFGTGAFLRGFVDYFLDEANRKGLFGGRVVAVGSTDSGRAHMLDAQDGLFTLAVRGVDGGAPREELRVISSVSRALSARDDWAAVLAVARTAELELIFSNTTEIGIAFDEADRPTLVPPRSFPGKLTRFLHERAHAFEFDPARGVSVLPCELIERNGARLRESVLALARHWELGERFIHWVEIAVPFHDTLVDRIVPGAPRGQRAEVQRRALGYDDALLTVCEPYRLFAVESAWARAPLLRFAAADAGIVLTDDITSYRERKVRLLNGAHTITAPVALLAGCDTVLEALHHELVGGFLRRTLFEEIAPMVGAPDAMAFARDVLERFGNPFIHHALTGITLQQTSKMRVRVVPSIVRYAEMMGRPPASLAFGFAAYLRFMRGDVHDRRRRSGLDAVADDHAARLSILWQTADDSPRAIRALANAACADVSLWGVDLTAIPGFADMVAEQLHRIVRAGVLPALEAHLATAAALA